MGAAELRRALGVAREALAARERQIERQAEEAAVQQGVMQQLQARNEELAMAKARVSEQDVAELQR